MGLRWDIGLHCSYNISPLERDESAYGGMEVCYQLNNLLTSTERVDFMTVDVILANIVALICLTGSTDLWSS